MRPRPSPTLSSRRDRGTGRPRRPATGVYLDLPKRLYRVRLWHAGRLHSGGYFLDFPAAVAGRDRLRLTLVGAGGTA